MQGTRVDSCATCFLFEFSFFRVFVILLSSGRHLPVAANVREFELRSASTLDCWLYWLLHAHEYEPAALAELMPQPAIRQATETLTRIAEITEDKVMYDARERAIRDREWERDATFREGEIKGEIKMIRALQGLLGAAPADEQELHALTLEQLQSLTSDLQEKLRNRTPS
jgi:hypothetical protein